MIKARKGIKNPRVKCAELLGQKGYCHEAELDNADTYIGNGLKIIVDFSDRSITWLIPQRHSIYHIGRVLSFDPLLSGDEIAEMVLDEARNIAKSLQH